MYRRRFLASVAILPPIAGCSAIENPLFTCASFDTNVDQTVCYDSKSEDELVWLDVSKPDWTVNTTNNSVETNVFTLHNESDESIPFNPHASEIHEKVKNSWSEIPNHKRKSTATLDPSETYRWVLSRKLHPSPNEENTNHITADIDVGEYAFLIEVPHDGSSLACVARFTVHILAS